MSTLQQQTASQQKSALHHLHSPILASLDLQSQIAQPQQFIDQMIQVLEVFAQLIDRRFFEVQDFMYHFNKTVLQSNKNFGIINSKQNTPLEQLQQYKSILKKEGDKRLSDELRNAFNRVFGDDSAVRSTGEGLLKGTLSSPLKERQSLRVARDSLQQMSSLQNYLSSETKQHQNSTQSNSNTLIYMTDRKKEGSPIKESNLLKSLATTHHLSKEESEVQEDDDLDLVVAEDMKKQNQFQAQLLSTNSQIKVMNIPGAGLGASLKLINYSTIGDEDTEGESVLMGDEEIAPIMQTLTKSKLKPHLEHNTTIQNSVARKRSPVTDKASTQKSNSKIQKSYHKHSTSPMRGIRPKTELKLQSHNSATERDEQVIETQNGPMSTKRSNDNKSPFSYTQRTNSKYNLLQQRSPPAVSQTTLYKTLSTQKPHSQSKSKSKSKTRQTTPTQSLPQSSVNSVQTTARVKKSPSPIGKQSNFIKQMNQLQQPLSISGSSSTRNAPSSMPMSIVHHATYNSTKPTTFEQSKIPNAAKIELQEPLLMHGSSGGSQSNKNFESQKKNSQYIKQMIDNQLPSLLISKQPSQVSEDEKIIDKSIKTIDIKNTSDNVMSKIMEVNDNRNVFEINLEVLETCNRLLGDSILGSFRGDDRLEQDDIHHHHRFTLQGKDFQQLISHSKRSSMQFSKYFDQQSVTNDIMGPSSIQSSKRQSLNYKNLEQNLQIMPPESMFQPLEIPQEIDLSQYNSPSFANLIHNQQAYQSLQRQLAANHMLNNSSSQDLLHQYMQSQQVEQKIILHNSVKKRTSRSGFLKLTGDILSLIGEYLNEKLPIFIFTNRISFKLHLQWQIEHYEQQRQIIVHQIGLINRDLDRMQNAKRFDLSMQCRDEYDSLGDQDWQDLIKLCSNHSKRISGDQSALSDMRMMKQKDVIILRLYLTFMGLEIASLTEDALFLQEMVQFLNDCGSTEHIVEIMDPEKSFLITDDNKKRIKELLVNLQKEKLLEDENNKEEGAIQQSTSCKITETFTNLLFEALQFVNIIPNVLVQDMKAEIEELRRVAEAFNGIKNNLIDFKNLVS